MNKMDRKFQTEKKTRTKIPVNNHWCLRSLWATLPLPFNSLSHTGVGSNQLGSGLGLNLWLHLLIKNDEKQKNWRGKNGG